MGRQTKLTPAVQRRICAAIRRGAGRSRAARLAGIGERTFYRWMADGQEAKSGAKWQLRQSVLDAEEKRYDRLMAELERLTFKSKNDGVRLAALRLTLERQYRDEWGPRHEVRQTGPDGGPVQVAAKVEAGLAPETMDALSPEAVADALVKLARGGGG